MSDDKERNMSDDLVKRLLAVEWSVTGEPCADGNVDETCAKEAAYRIGELEAKLAKAVDALEKLARLGNGDHYGNSEDNTIARAALATAQQDAPSLVIAIPRRLVPEVLQWMEDEIAAWPLETAYQNDLAKARCDILAMIGGKP
jgi:hypothetical protein